MDVALSIHHAWSSVCATSRLEGTNVGGALPSDLSIFKMQWNFIPSQASADATTSSLLWTRRCPSYIVINRLVFQLVVPVRSIVALETCAKGSHDTIVDVLRCY